VTTATHHLDRNPAGPGFAVRYTDTEWSTPVRVSHWWPVGTVYRDPAQATIPVAPEELVGEALSTHVGTGSFYHPGTGWRFGLVDGGKTQPVKTTREEVPAPRVRVETRWRNGRWEKRLKRKGWVWA